MRSLRTLFAVTVATLAAVTALPSSMSAADAAVAAPDDQPKPTRMVLGGEAPRLDVQAPPTAQRFNATEAVSLTLRHLDTAGALTPDAMTAIASLDGSVNQSVDPGTGEVTIPLPPGRYVLVSLLRKNDATHLLVQPLLELTGDTTVVLDSRQAKPLAFTVDDTRVRSFFSALYFARRLDDGRMMHFDLAAGPVDRVWAGQIGPDVPADQLTSSLATHWAVPGATGDFTDTPVTYNTLDTLRGKFFDGFQRQVRSENLARLVSRLHATAPGLSTTKSVTMLPPDLYAAWSRGLPRTGPGTLTEYVEPGAEVFASFQEASGSGEDWRLITELSWPASRTFVAGSTTAYTWNRAVLGPDVGDRSAMRYGNLLRFGIGLYDDQAGNDGWGLDDSAATRLYRNGELVAKSGTAGALGRGTEVDPGAATYRLESEVDRPDATRRSTRISAAWTFRSDTAPETGQALPLWTVRFRPEVGLDNQLETSSVPFTVKHVTNAAVGRLALPSVEVSSDGGTTWRRATVVPTGDSTYQAVFAKPAGAKSLSLRAKARDSAGNTVEQTILDAVGVR